MRARKPWFRASKNAWYVEVDGKQVRLAVGAENEKAAFDAFYKLMATGSPHVEKGLFVAAIGDLFLEFSSVNHSVSTYNTYRHFIQDFCRQYPRLLALETKPFHVSKWVELRPKWKGARWLGLTSKVRSNLMPEIDCVIRSNGIIRSGQTLELRQDRKMECTAHSFLIHSFSTLGSNQYSRWSR